MNCNHCNNIINNGGETNNTKTLNKIRRGNPYYIHLAVTLNGQPATEEQVRDISIYLVDERGNKTHLYDTTQSDNTISARVEGMERLGRYSAEIVYHPSGRKERVQDIKDVVEIVASSAEESINGEPISTEVIGINLSADMMVSLTASTSTTTAVDVDTKIDALRNEMLTEIWTIASNPRPTTPPTPQTKIRTDNGYLQVSYNDGYSWDDINLSDVSVGISHDGQYTSSTLANMVYNVSLNPQLSALHDRVTEIEGKTNQATPQTKIRVSEDDYTLQVSYDGGNRWEIIQLGNVVLDPMFGVQVRDIAPIIRDIPVTRAEYGELEDRINDISGADYLVETLESIQFAPEPDLTHVHPDDYSNAYAEQEMANRLPKSFVNQLLRLFNESMGKTARDPDILTRIYDLEKKVKALENK